MSGKKKSVKDEVVEDLNIDPNDIDTHELITVNAGGNEAEEIEANATENVQADEDKSEEKSKDSK